MTDLDLRECGLGRGSCSEGERVCATGYPIWFGSDRTGLDWSEWIEGVQARATSPPCKIRRRASPSRRRWSRDHRHRSSSYTDAPSCSLATLGRRPSSIEYKMALSQLDAALNRTARRFRNPHCRRQWSLVSRRILSGRASADAGGQFLHTKEETPTSHFDWHCVHRKKNERRTMEPTRD